MLKEEFRAARIRRAKSQSGLAKEADVPRSQLVILESGGNVTLSTMNKIADTLGERLHLLPASLDLNELRRNARDVQSFAVAMHAAAGRILSALDGGAPAPEAIPPSPVPLPAPGPLPGGGGATRHEAGVDPQLLERLERALSEAQRQLQKDSDS